jgi:ribose-phosphate pyrophosphokinase
MADYLDHSLCEGETIRFSEGNLFVHVQNVRERDVFLVQGTGFPTNDNFMELLFWVDALKRASAAVRDGHHALLQLREGRQKDEPRVSIRARVCADALEAAGANRIVTMDLHAAQVQGFFSDPCRRPLRPPGAMRGDPGQGVR